MASDRSGRVIRRDAKVPVQLLTGKLAGVVRSIERVGFVVQSRTWRLAELAHETTPQTILTFHREA